MSTPTAAWVDTPEKIARLKELWEARDANGKAVHSSADIGRILQVSKNSIVSWIGRKGKPEYGFTDREPPTWKGKARDPNAPPPATAPLPRAGPLTLPPLASLAQAHPPPAPPEPLPVGNLDCAWLNGEGTRASPFIQCTNKAIRFRPYCEGCAKRAYVKVRDRREDQDGDRPGA